MIDKKQLLENMNKMFENDLRRFVAEPITKDFQRELSDTIIDSLSKFLPEIRELSEEIYGPLVQLNERNNDISINVRRIAAAKYPGKAELEQAKLFFIDMYGEEYYNSVDGVAFAPDGFGFSVMFKQPVDYITIKLDVGDKIVKVSSEES